MTTGNHFGYAGKTLEIDLSSGTSRVRDTMRLSKRFVGGRGVATALYWEGVPPEASFDDERNQLILAMGPLAGVAGGLGGSRWGVFGKSPFPRPLHGGRDHFCYGNLGGSFGAELRFAGYDALVLRGKAEQPVWVEIQDDEVVIHDGSDLWGRTTVETMERVKEQSAPRSKSMAIGPAGEHCVPLATVFAEGDASCSGGMGAVMGSKNLKAVTVRGTKRKVKVADRWMLKQLERRVREAGRGNVKVWGMDFMAQGPQTRKYACWGCMGHCLRVKYRAENGSSGKFMCQSRFFYMNHAFGFYGEDNDVPFHANRLCDEMGIDTWEVQSLIEWLLTCHNEGAPAARESGLDFDKVGSFEFIQDLVEMTSHRRDFGDLLAQGAYGASRASGEGKTVAFTRTDPYDPRYCTVNTLLFPFETREPIQQLHEAGLVLSQWSSWAKGIEEAHISSDVIRGIGERFWGDERAADMTTLDGKAGAAKRIQERQLAKESVGVCDWMFPLIDIPTSSDHVGDPSVEARILTAVTGISHSEAGLARVGESVFNLQRAILLREGHRARADDYLPKEWHEDPIESHVADPELLAPGREGEIVSQLGRRADLPSFHRIRDEYYGLRDWDVPTGLQSREQLRELGLPEVAADLIERGLAVEKSRSTPLRARLGHTTARIRERFRSWRADRQSTEAAAGESLSEEQLMEILLADQKKYGLESIRHNFAGWNKTMQYYFSDREEYYLMSFVEGEAQEPEKLSEPLKKPDISYEMPTWVLAAMSAGELSGEDAYFKRKLKIKASFGDMMKLQALNKV